jgi:hypothetical protein
MKGTSLALLSLFVATPLCLVGEQLIPAGSLVQCTVSEPKLSSKTTAIGDPVLCQLSHSERYGRSVLPTNSYLVGRFEDYKDPGHFVGKGWMELRFDRMVIEPNTVIPVDARVVAVPGYNVDRNGRILGKGHAVRDAVLWSIPILWPVDLLMLPMRGPRPTLKEETRMTLKVMDDLSIPDIAPLQRDPYGFAQRPVAEAAPPPPPMPDPQYDQQPAAPESADYAPQDAPAYAPAPQQDYAPAPPPVYAYAPPPPPVYVYGGGGVVLGGSVGGYGGGYARGYAGGYAARGYAAGGYRPAPRPGGYGYGGAPRAYGYAGAQRGYGYAGAARGYSAAPRAYTAAPRGYGGYSYGAGARMASGGGTRGGGGGGAMRGGGGGRMGR